MLAECDRFPARRHTIETLNDLELVREIAGRRTAVGLTNYVFSHSPPDCLAVSVMADLRPSQPDPH